MLHVLPVLQCAWVACLFPLSVCALQFSRCRLSIFISARSFCVVYYYLCLVGCVHLWFVQVKGLSPEHVFAWPASLFSISICMLGRGEGGMGVKVFVLCSSISICMLGRGEGEEVGMRIKMFTFFIFKIRTRIHHRCCHACFYCLLTNPPLTYSIFPRYGWSTVGRTFVWPTVCLRYPFRNFYLSEYYFPHHTCPNVAGAGILIFVCKMCDSSVRA